MTRHSFIQMSKLSNVKGRISYITSPARQENLYATYHTADAAFWTSLARENQQEFKRSGTEGTCIEAREFIIALPEKFTRYDPQRVLTKFTEEFQKRYNVECVSGLHHNKAKTNYHIHLIFSERRLLPEPVVKVATRNMFYDEVGKHVRTKKEITGEDGQIRPGCTVIKKGEVYESHMFSVKDARFKQEGFVAEVKEFYTGLINRYISDPEQQLKVFDPQSVYLPTKKIGRNNPKAEEIKADNAARQEWNRTADTLYRQEALVADIIERGEIFVPLDAALAERHFFKRAACDERVFFYAVNYLGIPVENLNAVFGVGVDYVVAQVIDRLCGVVACDHNKVCRVEVDCDAGRAERVEELLERRRGLGTRLDRKVRVEVVREAGELEACLLHYLVSIVSAVLGNNADVCRDDTRAELLCKFDYSL